MLKRFDKRSKHNNFVSTNGPAFLNKSVFFLSVGLSVGPKKVTRWVRVGQKSSNAFEEKVTFFK